MIAVVVPSWYFGRLTNAAFQASLSYPPVTVGALSAVPSSVTVYSVTSPSAYSVNTTVAPAGAVVLPSAFFHALDASAVVVSCVFVIVSPDATGSVVDAV